MRGRLTVVEVGPRDGLQSEKVVLPTATKVRFIERLADAGLPVVEATSFVNPKAVPQLADAAEVLRAVRRRAGTRYPVLVPNEAGFDRAVAAGADEIAIFGSASESYSRKNLGRTRDEALEMFRPVVRRAKDARLRVRAYLSMVIADPWDGPTLVDAAVDAGRRLLDLGCDELSLGDTIGAGTPESVGAVVRAYLAAGVGVERLAAHFHDSRGRAIANVAAAVALGVRIVDASAGGLGGSTVVDDPHRNLATEDLLAWSEREGFATGVDRAAVAATGAWIRGELAVPAPRTG